MMKPYCIPHPEPCRPKPPRPCDYCEPCRPAQQSGGFLVPKIMGCGKLWQRCQRYCLTVSGIPRCAEAPYQLTKVSACSQQPWFEEAPCHERGALLIHATLPLLCELRDARNCLYSGTSSIEAQVRIHLQCPQTDCWRHSVLLTPCVRLAGRACSSCSSVFEDVPLEVVLDAYVVSYCAVGAQCAQNCPTDLPLYPQPRY